jgi:hypothetical protein
MNVEESGKKVVPIQAMKTYWGKGGRAAIFLNLGSRWRWVVNFKPGRSPPPPRKEPQYPLKMSLVRPRTYLDVLGERKIPCLYLKSNSGSSVL